MTNSKPKKATAADANALVDLLVLAFSTDPFMRWMYPDPHQYVTHRQTFFRILVDAAVAQKSAYIIGGYYGAAVWFPPGVHFDEDEVLSLLQRTVGDRVTDDLFAMIELVAAFHPDEPSWYLPLVGVDPARQGRGYGSSLLRHSLLACDRDQKVAYLDNTNSANIPLYERFGFEVAGTVQVGGSPTWYPMIRQPQSLDRRLPG